MNALHAIPGDLRLRVGDTVNLSLAGSCVGGSVWHVAINGDLPSLDARLEPLTSMTLGEPDASQALVVRARGPGRAWISLRLVNPAERPPREAHDIAVTVLP